MAIFDKYSRYLFTNVVKAEDGTTLYRTDPDPYLYEDRTDNRHHQVKDGDTLFSIAREYFAALSNRPDGLWWIIADYQQSPILDPTITLEAGSLIVIPSDRTVVELIFDQTRELELDLL